MIMNPTAALSAAGAVLRYVGVPSLGDSVGEQLDVLAGIESLSNTLDAWRNDALVALAISPIRALSNSAAACSESTSSGAQATRYSRPMIFTSRKFGSALISGVLGQLVHQTLEALAGDRHRLTQVQTL